MPDVRKCVVPGCNRRTERFNLPTNEARRAVWLSRSGLATPVDTEGRCRWKICPVHFDKKCFLKPNYLYRWAVPSLFLPAYNPTGGEEDVCFIKQTEAKLPLKDLQNPPTSKSQEGMETPQVVSNGNVKTEIASVLIVEKDWEQVSERSPEPESYRYILNENEDLKAEVQKLNLLVEEMKKELLVTKQSLINYKQIVRGVKELIDQDMRTVSSKQEI